MDEQQAAAQRLLELARPFLEREDLDGLAGRLARDWSPQCLKLLFDHADPIVVQTVATCLGLIGSIEDGPALAALLAHDEPLVCDAAEDALWSIFFRDGGPVAQGVLYRIARSIKNRDTASVVDMLTTLIKAYPNYAEAYHQRAQAHYLQNEFVLALRDTRRAAELNPIHFAALALAGHTQSALGRFPEALTSYRAALRIHPQMPGIRTSIQKVRQRLAPQSEAHISA